MFNFERRSIDESTFVHLGTNQTNEVMFEELGQVRLYMFLPTRDDKMVTINGERMSQNQWIYREVVKIVSFDRVALFDRYSSRLIEPEFEFSLPSLPDAYRILENLTKPFQWIEMEATRFHGTQMI